MRDSIDPSAVLPKLRTGGRHGIYALAVALMFSACASPSAHAAPGNPNVPGAAEVLFLEDFENRSDPNVAQSLGSYRGGPRAANSSYTADPYWLDDEDCNGIVFSGANPTFLRCPDLRNSFTDLRTMATRMAAFHGITDNAARGRESVLAAFTILRTDNPGNTTVFQLEQPVATRPGRFITVNADVTAVNCGSAVASFDFFLLDGGVERPLSRPASNDPFDFGQTPCSQPGAGLGKALRGDVPVLSTGGSFGFRIRNRSRASIGNDAALDNIALLDVTPQLDKQFARGPLANDAYGVNAVGRMTFTITNRDDLLQKSGWGFTETLPAGLTIAPTPNFASTCSFAATPVANPGAATLTVVNGTLAAAARSCTLEVDVTSATAGTYTNTPANLSNVVGLDLPGNATITFVAQPAIRLQKQLGNDRLQAGDQFVLSIAGGAGAPVAATTTGAAAAVTSAPATLDPATAGVAYTLSESAAGTTVLGNYQANWRCTNATPGGQTPSGSGTSFSVTPVATDNLSCAFVNGAAATDLQVQKTVDPAVARSGAVVTYRLVATNNGPAPANNAVLRDAPGAGLDCTQPSPTASCSASGGASCPGATVPVSGLTVPSGVVIPVLPAGGSITVTMQCTVTATGRP